ncbi:unnamed protein product, partial [Brassica oleracea var. botrytis]
LITPVVFVFRGVGREASCRWNRGCYQGERHENRHVGDFPLEEDQSPQHHSLHRHERVSLRRSCLSLNLMETPVKLRRWNRRVISSNGGWEKTWKAGATPWDLLDQLRSVNISLRRVHCLKAELLFLVVEPSVRPPWAQRIEKLLKPSGELITLMFPMDERSGGPPYKVSVSDYEKVLIPLGFEAMSIVDKERAITPRKV